MTTGVEIRRARPHEFDACADLYLQVLRDTFTWLNPAIHRREDFLAVVPHEEIYVAADGEWIVGLAAFYRPQNFLHSLYVSPRCAGVGKALLDHVIAVADGPVSLKAQAPNERARAFYLREGFLEAEEGRDPGSDIPWVRMVRP